MKEEDLERLLKQSLTSAAEPEERLNQIIIHQVRERGQMKNKHSRKVSAVLLAAVMLLVLSVSTYAAAELFSAKQVAENLGEQLLADAFASKDAIHINQTIASGDYLFTLHGVVSGTGLREFEHSTEDIYPDKTYAVVSIARQDGKAMPATADPDYGKEPFFVSPLVKGLNPVRYNIASMRGGYNETVINGVMYRLIECDQVEIFADRGIYLAISSDTTFYSVEAFRYDEITGEIQARKDYPGASVLFDLPLDITKADPVKAEAYLEELQNPSQDTSSEHEEWGRWSLEFRAKLRKGEEIGETIPGSIKEVTFDDSGNIIYTDGERSIKINSDNLFEKDQVGFTDKRFSASGGADDVYRVVIFHRDENGVITGRVIILDDEIAPKFE
ncbi:hypothetical protein [Paenibacillus senegalensis]|uniref:hypothetical protein n=1 Tax=Paenibacillus senegalensis TaxID=1465766 RepID=UPI0002889B1B|nr:hypothetical protein [Paenibacillus senegalensis]